MANLRNLLSTFSLGFAVRAACLSLLCFWYASATPAMSGEWEDTLIGGGASEPELRSYSSGHPEPKQWSFNSLGDTFEVNRRSEVECGYHNLSPGQAITIQSKNYPGKPPKKHTCLWDFEGTADNSTISITCHDIKMEGCLKVKGTGLKTRLCGNMKNPKVRSADNKLTVQFKSGEKPGRGFQCTVRASGTPAPTTTTAAPTTTPAGCRCGVPNSVGKMTTRRTQIAPNTYPWAVAIVFFGTDIPRCGGSIIGTRWILTDVKCIQSRFGLIVDASIIIGEHDYTSSSDTAVKQTLGAAAFIPHEDYDGDTEDNNIGLIELTEDIIFPLDNTIAPICLPDADTPPYIGVSAIAAGWGSGGMDGCGGMEGNNTNEIMSETTTTLDNCQGSYTFGIPNNVFCVERTDYLQDDEGGPLITNFMGATPYYVQIGIYSFCSPGLYTNVSHYMDWINTQITNLTTCRRPN